MAERARKAREDREAKKAARNVWFNDTFLPSLFAMAGVGKNRRISLSSLIVPPPL